MTTKSQGRAIRGGGNSPPLSISGMVRSVPRKSKAYSYIRFSSQRQEEGDSVRRQTDAAEKYAAAHGLELDRTLSLRDLGVSAYSGANVREGAALRAFLDAIESGRVPKGSVLLVESLDRLSRQTARKALRVLEEIVEAGVDVVTLTDGRRFTSESLDGFDLMFALLEMIRGHRESARKSELVKASWVGRRKAYGADAIVPGQRHPFWLRIGKDRQAELDPKGAKEARRIVAAYLAGSPVREIVRDLNRRGVPSPQGRTWSRTQVSRTLRGIATRSGLSAFKPAELGRLRAALARRRSGQGGRPRKDGGTSILRGLGRCGYCGQALAFAQVPKSLAGGVTALYSYLRCTTNAEHPGRCDGPAHIRYEPVAQAVVELALKVADSPPPVSRKAAEAYRVAAKRAEDSLRHAEKMREALEAAPSKAGAASLRDAFAAYQEAQQAADAAWDAARPGGYGTIDADALRAAVSDTEMNRALRVFLESVEVRHDDPKPDNSLITFHYIAGGTAVLRYVATPRKRADAGKPRKRK